MPSELAVEESALPQREGHPLLVLPHLPAQLQAEERDLLPPVVRQYVPVGGLVDGPYQFLQVDLRKVGV
jgi:hypothetical protein